MVIEIEIECLPKTSFYEEAFSFGCDGEDNAKPFAIERFDRLIEVGKNCWIPGKDDGHSLDRHKYIVIQTKLDFGQKFAGSPSARDVEHGIFLHDLVSVFEHEPHAAEVSKGCPTTFEV